MLRHLHSNPNENALWLDTTGSFSAEWASKLTESLEKQTKKPPTPATGSSSPLNGDADSAMTGNNEVGSDTQTPSALDRLIVAKVFDLQSAIQAIQQVRSQQQHNDEEEHRKREESKVPASGTEGRMAVSEATIYSDVVPETGVPAQDMLLASSPGQLEHSEEENKDGQTKAHAPHLSFIVIDSISALLKGVLSATSAEGHARMMSFMRLLRSLTTSSSTTSRQFTTVFVVNNLVSLASTANSTAALHSVFPTLNSKRVKAALGPTFTYLTDWTVYLSPAGEVFRTSNSAEHGANSEGENVIFEVIRSRRMVSSGTRSMLLTRPIVRSKLITFVSGFLDSLKADGQ